MNKYNIPGVKTFEYTKIVGIENIEFGRNIIIDDFVFIYAKKKIRIGNFVHIASYASISGGEEFSMEEFSGLSSGCRIITATDDFKEHGFGNPTISNQFRNIFAAPIKINKFAIVGANSVIMPGITIGEGATIGANSVVTKNIDPWGIYIGNRKVGNRNKELVLDNHKKFLEMKNCDQLGALFQPKGKR